MTPWFCKINEAPIYTLKTVSYDTAEKYIFGKCRISSASMLSFTKTYDGCTRCIQHSYPEMLYFWECFAKSGTFIEKDLL